MEFGEVYRWVLHYERVGASAIQNVFHAQYRGATLDDEDFMSNFALWLTDDPFVLSEWAAVASSQVECTKVTAAVMNLDGTVLRNLPERAFLVPGEVLFDSMAAATSGQIRFETGVPGRRGMKYVPGLADPRVNLGLLDSAAITGMLDFGAALLALSGEHGELISTLGVLSKAIETFTPFLDSVGSGSNPIYQRRRGPGRGA